MQFLLCVGKFQVNAQTKNRFILSHVHAPLVSPFSCAARSEGGSSFFFGTTFLVYTYNSYNYFENYIQFRFFLFASSQTTNFGNRNEKLDTKGRQTQDKQNSF